VLSFLSRGLDSTSLRGVHPCRRWNYLKRCLPKGMMSRRGVGRERERESEAAQGVYARRNVTDYRTVWYDMIARGRRWGVESGVCLLKEDEERAATGLALSGSAKWSAEGLTV